MKVKGTAFLARKSMLEADLGVDRLAEILRDFRDRHREFPWPVLPTTTIPIALFLELNDGIVEQVYEGDRMSYWRFGIASANWALIDGPYRRMRLDKSVDEFIASARPLYRNYFTAGRAEARRIDDDTVELIIDGIAAEHHHVYFEYAIVGYFERGLGLVANKGVSHERLEGFSAGDPRVRYRLRLRRANSA